MSAILFVRSLELAFHFVILGGLAAVALQLHHGQWLAAILHAIVACICIVLSAASINIAKKLLGKD